MTVTSSKSGKQPSTADRNKSVKNEGNNTAQATVGAATPPNDSNIPVSLSANVDLNQLTVVGLKRYKRVFKLQAKSNARPDLANAVNAHFDKEQVDEQKTVYNFIYMIKNKKSKLHNTDN